MASIVKKCKKCKELKYIVSDNICLSCFKTDNPEEVLIGIYTDKCTIEKEWIDDVIKSAQKNFPRIVHSNKFNDIDGFVYCNVNIKKEHILSTRFNVYYNYKQYNGQSMEEKVSQALKDLYKDLIEQKFKC